MRRQQSRGTTERCQKNMASPGRHQLGNRKPVWHSRVGDQELLEVEQETKDKPTDMESTRMDQVTMVDPTVQKTKAELVEVDETTTLLLAAQNTTAGPSDME